MISTSKYFLLAVILIISISSCHKDEEVESKYLLGDWWIQQLIINGIDTTPFLQKDTNCFGFTRFEVYNTEYMLKKLPVYTEHYLSFSCFTNGYFIYPFNGTKNMIKLKWSDGTNSCGPYLSDSNLVWNVDVLKNSEMKLSINYHGMPCTASYKR